MTGPSPAALPDMMEKAVARMDSLYTAALAEGVLGQDGAIGEVMELDPALWPNSIRHLALAADGTLAFAMQWGVGALINTWPSVEGQYPEVAYSVALACCLGLQVPGLLIWLSFKPSKK